MRNKRYMGQHFLRCVWVTSTMVHAADLSKEDTVLEVGPGTGALTRSLAARAKRVIAVEKDEQLARSLTQSLSREKIFNVTVVSADILKFLADSSVKSVLRGAGFKVVSNIPYYLTSRLFRELFEKNRPELIVMTIQKEVAGRICAKPPKMNLLGVSVQVFGTPKIVKTVPRSCFLPPPQVQSAIIKISNISDKLLVGAGLTDGEFFAATKVIFGGRRKTLLNNISTGLGKETAKTVLAASDIAPQTRAGELSLGKILLLAKAYVETVGQAKQACFSTGNKPLGSV